MKRDRLIKTKSVINFQQPVCSNYQLLVKLFFLALTFSFSLLTFPCFSQGVAITNDGNPAANSAILDVRSTSGGTLLPRMTTANMTAISNPADGLMIFNTDCQVIDMWNAQLSLWVPLGNQGSFTTPALITSSNATPCMLASGITYSTAAVPGATGYNWTIPSGASITSGQGTASVTVTLGAGTGSICVTANNACGTSNATCLTPTYSTACGCPFTDSRDGQTYATVQIASQCWMAQNLNYGTFTPESTTPTQPSTYTSKWCYGDVASNCLTYGGLYQWADAMTGLDAGVGCDGTGASQPPCTSPVQGICPTGWHLPSMYEWISLENNLCSIYNCSTYSGSCVGDFPWDDSRNEAQPRGGSSGTTESDVMKVNVNTNPVWIGGDMGTNLSGFSALPAGTFSLSSSGYSGLNFLTAFWTSYFDVTDGQPFNFELVTDVAEPQVVFGWETSTDGISVRCVHN